MDEKQENEMGFGEFIAARMRDKGIPMKRLSEMTGITPGHLENLVHGNFDEIPSTPYFRGYVMRIGKVLEFDGDAWWAKIKRENVVKNSGPTDELPRNRFIKKKIPKSYWALGVIGVIVIAYIAITLPRIMGKPALTVMYPNETPFITAVDTLTLQGTVQNADALYLSNGATSSSEEITIGPNGAWQESVLLQGGLNSFEITAKKLLGGSVSVTEEIVYQEPATTSTATSSPSALPANTTTPDAAPLP